MIKLEPTNKIALVTGGSRGLGWNIALQLARKGNDVILTYRQKKEEGEAVVAEIEALGRKAIPVAVLIRRFNFVGHTKGKETKWLNIQTKESRS
jgi:NAD(P)-dependent dehydrogenase (short-subunit alcohol dehydrogenase family)